MTNDGVRAYSWDEADRLIEVRDLQTSDVLVQNRYDGLIRRRERIQLEDGILVTNRYVYDGWLVVAVLDGDNEVLEQYVHGVDLSGTRVGAGGIGGILQAVGDEVAYYHYDGNGNVISATDSNAVVMTRLEYDPFGRVLVADGSYTPRYQFSSKEDDTATGLNYYGYRYYSPGLGRWLSRDPIQEQGFSTIYFSLQGIRANEIAMQFEDMDMSSMPEHLAKTLAIYLFGTDEHNVYAFNGNEPVASCDALGLFRIRPPCVPRTCPPADPCNPCTGASKCECYRGCDIGVCICRATCAVACLAAPGYFTCFLPCNAACTAAEVICMSGCSFAPCP